MKSAKDDKRRERTRKRPPTKLPFEKENYVLFALSLLILVIGYLFLTKGPWDSTSSLTIAPILLVIGYCVTLPLAIMYRKKSKNPENTQTESELGS